MLGDMRASNDPGSLRWRLGDRKRNCGCPAEQDREGMGERAGTVLKGATEALEVQLLDGDVTPVAKVLIARRIPMVFQSDADLPPELQSLSAEAHA
jgi:hypothetical protein